MPIAALLSLSDLINDSQSMSKTVASHYLPPIPLPDYAGSFDYVRINGSCQSRCRYSQAELLQLNRDFCWLRSLLSLRQFDTRHGRSGDYPPPLVLGNH